MHVHVQTALTELKTKLKLEQRLGDKEKELSAVKQKLQEVTECMRACWAGIYNHIMYMYIQCVRIYMYHRYYVERMYIHVHVYRKREAYTCRATTIGSCTVIALTVKPCSRMYLLYTL